MFHLFSTGSPTWPANSYRSSWATSTTVEISLPSSLAGSDVIVRVQPLGPFGSPHGRAQEQMLQDAGSITIIEGLLPNSRYHIQIREVTEGSLFTPPLPVQTVQIGRISLLVKINYPIHAKSHFCPRVWGYLELIGFYFGHQYASAVFSYLASRQKVIFLHCVSEWVLCSTPHHQTLVHTISC